MSVIKSLFVAADALEVGHLTDLLHNPLKEHLSNFHLNKVTYCKWKLQMNEKKLQ